MLDFRSFNVLESNSDYADIMSVIKNAFNDMADNDIATFHHENVENYEHIFYVSIDLESDISSISFEEFYEINKKQQSRLEDVKIAMDRIENVCDLSTDFEYEFGDYQHTEAYITITFDMKSKEKSKGGEFWRIGVNNAYKFDTKLLKKFLGMNDIKIGMSSNGREKFLNIKFDSEEMFDKHKDAVINKLLNYKIDGVGLLMELTRDLAFGEQVTAKFVEEHEYGKLPELSFCLNKEIKFW